MTTAARRVGVIDLSVPAWVQSTATIVGAAIAGLYISRSVAKKKIAAAIDEATTQLSAANENLMRAQSKELEQLRLEVVALRSTIQGLMDLNQRYGAAIAEKDMRVSELQRDIRVRDAKIMELELRRK